MTFWAASGFLWQHLASFIKNKIKQSKNKAICYHILVFTVLKEQRVASSQKIHQGRCFTFIKGQRDNCLFSKMNLPVLYIPWEIFCKYDLAILGQYQKLLCSYGTERLWVPQKLEKKKRYEHFFDVLSFSLQTQPFHHT